MKPCVRCGKPVVRGRPFAVYCSARCAWTSRNERLYEDRQRRAAALRRKRPRCLICDKPLRYGTNGFRLSATTCSRRCAVTKWNWYFHRRSIDADRRALADEGAA